MLKRITKKEEVVFMEGRAVKTTVWYYRGLEGKSQKYATKKLAIIDYIKHLKNTDWRARELLEGRTEAEAVRMIFGVEANPDDDEEI